MSTPLRPAYADPRGTIAYNFAGNSLIVHRDTTPAAASPSQASAAGYAKACLWFNSTGSVGAGTLLFVNTGTPTTAVWQAII